MDTKLKTYRSETKFEADRRLMEAQGWTVRSGQRRSSAAPVHILDLDHAIPDPYERLSTDQKVDYYLNVGGPLSHAAGYSAGAVSAAAGCARILALPFILAAWPFAWAWRRWQSGPRWDVLYERGSGSENQRTDGA